MCNEISFFTACAKTHFCLPRLNRNSLNNFNREDYTYKRLRDYNRLARVESPASVDSVTGICGSPNCSGTTPFPRWYPFQSHRVQNVNIPRDMVALNACKRPVQRKKSSVVQRLAAKQLAQVEYEVCNDVSFKGMFLAIDFVIKL